MENLKKDLEKHQDELKVRIWYDGSIEALYRMLSKQKNSKDTRGLGFDTGECSIRKNVSNKEIQFVTSSENDKGKNFTVKNASRKKIDLTITGEDMKGNTNATRRNNVDPKGKGKMREDSFTSSKNMRRESRRPPTDRK